MKNTYSIFKVFFLLTGLCFWACDTDKLPPVSAIDCSSVNYTYDMEAKAIIDATCAYSGCHVSGFSDGDFSNYNGMLSRLENESIAERVLNDRDMPPNYADGPTSLTEEQFEIINCWIQNGYPEN